ncbi:MAG: ATP-binding protein [Desulfobacterales bacterium]|nr:ATP-binding protein [Desulfobacterales bacterium]
MSRSSGSLQREPDRAPLPISAHGLAVETEHLVASIPSLLIGLDANDRIVLWNTQAEALLERSAAEVGGRPLDGLDLPWDRDRILAGLAACRSSGRPVRIEDIACTLPGQAPRVLGLTVNPMADGTPSPLRLILMGADITARKQLEEQLAQAQKMEAIGQMAAGIAHEISTPAQFVGDNTQFLREAFGDLQQVLTVYGQLADAVRKDGAMPSILKALEATIEEADLDYLAEEVPNAIEHIMNGVERISRIVRSMKLFAHPGGEEKTPVDLNEAIESTIVITRNEWKYVAELTTDLDPQLPPVPCLRGEFNQVILNLITNAAHAIADAANGRPGTKGSIHVATACRPQWAEIRIQDSGTGIPEAIRHKVFDLFFTTKEEGRGSGQGLALAHAVIVDQLGGQLRFETTEGRGTTFILRLPREAEAHGHG